MSSKTYGVVAPDVLKSYDGLGFLKAIIAGTVLQAAMMVLGHFFPWIRVHVFLFGGMMISATAGYLYAMDYGAGFGRGIFGGAIAGAQDGSGVPGDA